MSSNERRLLRSLSARGFTLIEMLVVMVLLGLIASMALPAMQRWHDAVQAKSQVSALVQSVRAAIFAAGAQRRVLRLAAGSFEPELSSAGGDVRFGVEGETVKLSLPPGWKAGRVSAAAFLPSGLCEPGAVELVSDSGAVMLLQVVGPVCGVSLSTGGRRDG